MVVPDDVRVEGEWVWCRCCKGNNALKVRMWGISSTAQAAAVKKIREHEASNKYKELSHTALDYIFDPKSL